MVVIKHRTERYERMAKTIATTQTGRTVLLRNPTPNGRKAPFGK